MASTNTQVARQEHNLAGTGETPDTVLPLSVWRTRAKARGRRTEYMARAYRCGDMAVRAGSAHDAQFLRAMTIVWQILADNDAADAPAASNFAEIAPPTRGTI